jgi:membrane protease YdiL (CAAX protease family)
MEVVGGVAYALVAGSLALGLFVGVDVAGDRSRRAHLLRRRVDRRDLITIAATYALVVASYRIAFVVVEDNDLLLFAFFALGLLIGVVGPVTYTTWRRGRPLASLGLSVANLPRVVVLGLTFAAVQFAITLWGYELPGTRGWVTLLGMALMVGIFEAIFFRGFVQGRLETSFGPGPAVFGGALLYAAYHVGYGMGFEETAFLFGLGIVYALAYLTVRNVLVLWPLLTPLGSLYAQLEEGELVGRLPWAALLGFADVMAVMATVIWFAHRHERRALVPDPPRGGRLGAEI